MELAIVFAQQTTLKTLTVFAKQMVAVEAVLAAK